MDEEIRLNKLISEAGVCSRRQADELIKAGKVLVNNKTALPGQKVQRSDEILIDQIPLSARQKRRTEEPVVIALNKPTGYVCSEDGQGSPTIFELIDLPIRLVGVGRLDKDSEGLLLLTNDGTLSDAISRARNKHEKEYAVTVNKTLTKEAIEAMRKGIYLKDLERKTKPCIVKQTGERSFTIVLTEGLNRQIRRMCQACGYTVTRLVRVRVMQILLGNIPKGHFRHLTKDEIRGLYQRVGLGD